MENLQEIFTWLLCLDSNTKSQCWSVVAVLYRTLASILTFTAIYPWSVFALHLFGLPVLTHASNCIYFAVACLCLLAIHITFPCLQYFALQYSFGPLIKFLVPLHVQIFCSLFCQQPFWIFILYNRMLVKCYWLIHKAYASI